MSAGRFFIEPNAIRGDSVILSTDIVRQVRSVLRMQVGDTCTLLDGSGWEYQVELTELGKTSGAGKVVSRSENQNEPQLQLTLFQGVLKKDKFEWILQKGTELGVSAFVPVMMERSVRTEVKPKLLQRWQKIVREAAEQCRRGKLPTIHDPIDFEAALAALDDFDTTLLPWVREDSKTIAGLAPLGRSTAILIGPEGGFAPKEVVDAIEAGAQPITLGKRILRAETASIAACTLALAKGGELG